MSSLWSKNGWLGRGDGGGGDVSCTTSVVVGSSTLLLALFLTRHQWTLSSSKSLATSTTKTDDKSSTMTRTMTPRGAIPISPDQEPDKKEETNVSAPPPPHSPKRLRIFMDGVFDLMHYGHMNAFRLSRALGAELVVGVNGDESVLECKGWKPLLTTEERVALVSSCRFVDEVISNVPYVMTADYLQDLIETYNVSVVCHGDDACLDVHGNDVYQAVKEAGKFQSIPRTQGISTTQLSGRLLEFLENKTSKGDYLCRTSPFFTTAQLLRQFSAAAAAGGEVSPENNNQTVGYIDGAFDVFHLGHVQLLEKAKETCDYLIVGVYGDELVNQLYGKRQPILSLQERILSVMGCRFVNDVLMDAPLHVTPELLAFLKITHVVVVEEEEATLAPAATRYAHAHQVGKVHRISPPHDPFGVTTILQRMQESQEVLQSKVARKQVAEMAYYQDKHYSQVQGKMAPSEDKKEAVSL